MKTTKTTQELARLLQEVIKLHSSKTTRDGQLITITTGRDVQKIELPTNQGFTTYNRR